MKYIEIYRFTIKELLNQSNDTILILTQSNDQFHFFCINSIQSHRYLFFFFVEFRELFALFYGHFLVSKTLLKLNLVF
jgi:hypothetical protein